jgi:hypothetical protein
MRTACNGNYNCKIDYIDCDYFELSDYRRKRRDFKRKAGSCKFHWVHSERISKGCNNEKAWPENQIKEDISR